MRRGKNVESLRVVNGPTNSGRNTARAQKYKPEPENQFEVQIMPEKKTKVKLGLKKVSGYFDYIFVHLRQKARLRSELSQKVCQL